MEQVSSSSKVTVEYFDPYGVYRLLSPGLLPRLPLRNLHWESHAGPLRSIQALYIDLLPSLSSGTLSNDSTSDLSHVRSPSASVTDDGFTVQNLSGTVGLTVESKTQSSTIPGASSMRGRRHQIRGLHQTPYLKILFLRCDDNETYKTRARKQAREWVREHTTPVLSAKKASAAEKHDAFEWLIVHVIVPNTAAATQPRTSSKGTSTLLEKLKADFNGSSKTSLDRIVQIRIGINDVPYDLLPRVVPAIPGSYVESAQEHQESWLDLVAKLKSSILLSFDMRVSQYEEDIREKDAQRALPGWNFCTFFVLKEGLARGFENVGLVEDSLVGYDELAVGLDTIVREQTVSGSGTEHGGSFLPFTEELRVRLEESVEARRRDSSIEEVVSAHPIDLQDATKKEASDQDEIPLNPDRKNYRELILANNISVFDFRCYLFSRQLALLLRLANASSSREELLAKLKEQRESSLMGVAARQPPSLPVEEKENLSVLDEICQRALRFIPSISRDLRADLVAGKHTKQDLESDDENSSDDRREPFAAQAIDDLVASFVFSVAQQILAQTSTKSLPIPPSSSTSEHFQGHEQKSAIPEPKTMMHPARSTSLALRTGRERASSPGVFPGGPSQADEPAGGGQFLKAGLEDLAAHRAELYLLSRGVLEQLGEARGFSLGWKALSNFSFMADNMDEISLSDEPEVGKVASTSIAGSASYGMSNPFLKVAVSSAMDFYRLYETLTDKALRHFTVASRTQSMQSCMSDLAVLKYHQDDFATAASYFYRVVPYYAESGWAQMEASMLLLYARCLKELDRKKDYVRIAVKLLTSIASREKARLLRVADLNLGSGRPLDSVPLGPSQIPTLKSIVSASSDELVIPMQSFFAHVVVASKFQYHESEDSYSLSVKFRFLLADALEVEKIRVKIVPAVAGQGKEIWLESAQEVEFGQSTTGVQVMVPGLYVVKQIVLQAPSLIISYDTESAPPPDRLSPRPFLSSPKLLLFQRPQSLDVGLKASLCMHLTRTRTLEISVSSGWNELTSGELHIRGATAGLRLQTSDVTVVDRSLNIDKKSEAGIIRFGGMAANHCIKLRLPFTVENEVPEIRVRLEISYTTPSGTFFFAAQPKISIMLPLGVNVQDIFKHKTLFSKFSITSATMVPIRLLSGMLAGSDLFDTSTGTSLQSPVTIFPKQPATLLYKISRKRTSDIVSNRGQRQNSSLALTVLYTCVDEEIDAAVKQNLEAALQADAAPLAQFSRIVTSAVLQQLHDKLLSHDYERAALLDEVSLTAISHANWSDFFVGLGVEESSGEIISHTIARWLQAWQKKLKTLELSPLEINDKSLGNARSIIIPVEVPSMTVVHTADLCLQTQSVKTGVEMIALLNDPLSYDLKIKWTRVWDTSSTALRPEGQDLEFVYELNAPTDTWLIGGKRKGHFRVPAAKDAPVRVLSFPVLLIPVREGYLPYPTLDIKPVTSSRTMRGKDSKDGEALVAEGEGRVSCETDYKNTAEVVRVISGAKRTTVSLDASGPQGGAWLLESERWEQDRSSVG